MERQRAGRAGVEPGAGRAGIEPGVERTGRTRLSPEDRRAQLVALGVAALADRPLDALSIESLSAQAGVSRGLLFHYFGSLQGLHREVVSTARDALLHATEPVADLAPLDRLDDTLTRVVRFVRDHSGTFSSLVRGVAAGDPAVREVVEEARQAQADRLLAVFVELGAADTGMLRIALRGWVSFAEHALIALVIEGDADDAEIVAFLDRSARAVAASVTDGEDRAGEGSGEPAPPSPRG